MVATFADAVVLVASVDRRGVIEQDLLALDDATADRKPVGREGGIRARGCRLRGVAHRGHAIDGGGPAAPGREIGALQLVLTCERPSVRAAADTRPHRHAGADRGLTRRGRWWSKAHRAPARAPSSTSASSCWPGLGIDPSRIAMITSSSLSAETHRRGTGASPPGTLRRTGGRDLGGFRRAAAQAVAGRGGAGSGLRGRRPGRKTGDAAGQVRPAPAAPPRDPRQSRRPDAKAAGRRRRREGRPGGFAGEPQQPGPDRPPTRRSATTRNAVPSSNS